MKCTVCQREKRTLLCELSRMPPLNERIKAAREACGYSTAADAVRAHGWVRSTYFGYENGDRAPSRDAATVLADAFNVSLDWLLTGHGSMRGASEVEVWGRIGAGYLVTEAEDAVEIARGPLALPRSANTWAFIVQGDSMRPRFYPDEILIFDKRPAPLAALVGQYCLVQLRSEKAERYVKILRRGRGEHWRLELHNADPIEDVELFAAWRWLALLPPRSGELIVPELPRRQKRR